MSVNATTFSPFSTFASTAYGSASGSTAAASSGTAAANGSDAVDTTSSNGSMYGLTTDDFLKLFLAELQNQDPTQPVDNAQMLNQLSQMSNIQTMQGIQKSLEGSQLAQASALIGRNVTGLDVNGDKVDGVVTAVTQSTDAGMVLQVGSQYIKPDSVVNVTAPTSTPTS
jgi:flagellar basal-body rod modification protein FlgD